MNEITGPPGEGAVGDDLCAELERVLALQERRRRENAARKPASAAQRERANLRQRLARVAKRVEALAADLEQRHGDKAGHHHYALLPLVADSVMRGPPRRPGLLDQLERIERDAAAGCELSAEFAAHYGPLLRLCDHLRYVRPPPRAPDYDPLAMLSDEQRAYLRLADEVEDDPAAEGD